VEVEADTVSEEGRGEVERVIAPERRKVRRERVRRARERRWERWVSRSVGGWRVLVTGFGSCDVSWAEGNGVSAGQRRCLFKKRRFGGRGCYRSRRGREARAWRRGGEEI